MVWICHISVWFQNTWNTEHIQQLEHIYDTYMLVLLFPDIWFDINNSSRNLQ